MTERIFRYLREQQPETPCLVVDLDVVENNFRRMRELLPAAHIFYAVKANPAAQILARLATAGSKFDTASRGEIELVQATGVSMDRVSFGNTIKKEKDIAWAYQQGVRLFAFDSEAESPSRLCVWMWHPRQRFAWCQATACTALTAPRSNAPS